MSLPAFEKVGTMFSAPSWLTDTGNDLVSPRLFDNDAVRDNLPDVPTPRFSIVYASDHSSGSGFIGRADAATLTGTWTDVGSSIHSGPNQRETPFPIYDPDNNRINVYVHDHSSSITHGTQAARLLTTTDLATLTDQGETGMVANHSGYGIYDRNADTGVWTAYTVFTGGELSIDAKWTSPDGTNDSWTLSQLTHPGAMHIAGVGKTFGGAFPYWTYDGQRYASSILSTRPRLSNSAELIAAWPVDDTLLRPTGGYYTILEPGGSGDDDESGIGSAYFVYVDSVLYIIYVGTDSAGDRHVMLARETTGNSTQVAPQVTVLGSDHPMSPGAISPLTRTNTTIVDWDAASDDLPTDDLEIAVNAGTDDSSHSPGNYYELKTGSGSSQNIQLRTLTSIDPRDFEAVEYRIEGLRFDATPDTTACSFLFGLTGGSFGGGTLGGFNLVYDGSGGITTSSYGMGHHYINSTRVDVPAYVCPWCDPSASDSVGKFTRNHTFDSLTFLVHDSGDRLSIFIDDHVCYHNDVSSILSWEQGALARFSLISKSPHPAQWARFARFSVLGLEQVPDFGQRRWVAGQLHQPGFQSGQKHGGG